MHHIQHQRFCWWDVKILLPYIQWIPFHLLHSLWYQMSSLSFLQSWSFLLLQENKCCVPLSETVSQRVKCDGTLPNDLKLLENQRKKPVFDSDYPGIFRALVSSKHWAITRDRGKIKNECTYDLGFCILHKAKKKPRRSTTHRCELRRNPQFSSAMLHTHNHSSPDKVQVCDCRDAQLRSSSVHSLHKAALLSYKNLAHSESREWASQLGWRKAGYNGGLNKLCEADGLWCLQHIFFVCDDTLNISRTHVTAVI